jgi:hydroxymethylpyrimidine/phosphomethylpyrimidine kinase
MPAPAALAISAVDSGGGLLATDLLVFDALGVRGAGVATAATVHGIRRAGPVHDLPVALLREGVEAAFARLPLAAVKVGIVTTVPAIRAVARALAALAIPRVVDPGFAPRSGVRLLRSGVVDTFVRDLFPGASIAIVNLPEASVLAGFAIREEADAKAAARRVQALGPSAVLVTGGCAEGLTLVDGLLDGRTWHRFECPRAELPPACGAGDLLSAAVTALLATGETLPDAVSRALAFVHRALAAGWPATPRLGS